jgi:uncharacterized membrane protein YjfL (UPF0719 family)
MDLILFITGLVQVALSLLIGVLFIYAASKVFRKMIKGINENDELKNNNIAVAILNSAIIIALILVVSNSIESAITIFGNTLRNPDAIFSTYVRTALIMLLHIIIAGIVAFSSIYIAMHFFMWLTKDLDELAEIKKNNIAVSLLLGIIIISIALLLQPGITTILDSLIPYPPVSLIDIGNL